MCAPGEPAEASRNLTGPPQRWTSADPDSGAISSRRLHAGRTPTVTEHGHPPVPEAGSGPTPEPRPGEPGNPDPPPPSYPGYGGHPSPAVDPSPVAATPASRRAGRLRIGIAGLVAGALIGG